MIRHLLLAFALLAAPAAAQTTTERVEKARAEVNTAENALGRAIYALDKALADMKAQAPVPTPTPSPTPLPAPAPKPASMLASDVPTIAGGFDRSAWLRPAGIPGDMGADPVGAFRLICQVSWVKQVDPLVQPGAAKSMHLHVGWGNDAVDANSDYASLRSKGLSDCQGGPLYRSAAWAPALLDGEQVVLPDYVSIYYKRFPSGSPDCLKLGAKGCAEFPAGLRLIIGRNYAVNGPASTNIAFTCGAKTGTVWADVMKDCPVGAQIEAQTTAPQCWDGVHIDSPDHQSHMAYPPRNRQTGQLRCPDTHPFVIPQLKETLVWIVRDGERFADYTFSVDKMMGTPAGAMFHIDYWEAQEPSIRLAWQASCIDNHLNCSGGVLGDGRKFVEPEGFSFKAVVRRVSAPR